MIDGWICGRSDAKLSSVWHHAVVRVLDRFFKRRDARLCFDA